MLGGQHRVAGREPARGHLAQVRAAVFVPLDGVGAGAGRVEPGAAGAAAGRLPAGRAGVTQQDIVGGAGEHPAQPPGQQPPAVPLGQAGGAVPGPAAPYRAQRQVAVQDRVIKAPGSKPGLVLEAAQHLGRDPGHQAAGAGREGPAQRRRQRADGDLVAAGQGLQPAVDGLARDGRDPQRQRPGRPALMRRRPAVCRARPGWRTAARR